MPRPSSSSLTMTGTLEKGAASQLDLLECWGALTSGVEDPSLRIVFNSYSYPSYPVLVGINYSKRLAVRIQSIPIHGYGLTSR